VREALARLAAEGFIEATPRRGFHVRRPSERQVTDLWQVRGGLEVMAGELFIARVLQGSVDAAQLDRLAAVLERIASTLDAIDGREHIELNRQFHGNIVELSGNELLVSMYRGIQMQLLAAWVKRGLGTWRARVQAEADDHQELLDALRALDAPRYGAAARRHVDTSLRNALSDLAINKTQPNPAAADSGKRINP
jgi:DNA-binding GntR family transcriptional regulator